MSRVTVAAKDPNHEIIVGLDPPLGFWFIQVWNKDDLDREDPVFWKDTRSNYEMCTWMRKYCDLNADISTQKAFWNIQGDFDPARPCVLPEDYVIGDINSLPLPGRKAGECDCDD